MAKQVRTCLQFVSSSFILVSLLGCGSVSFELATRSQSDKILAVQPEESPLDQGSNDVPLPIDMPSNPPVTKAASCFEIEAESGIASASQMIKKTDSLASNQMFVQATPNTNEADKYTFGGNAESMEYRFNVQAPGRYHVWVRIASAASNAGNDDSFWVSSNQMTPKIYDTAECRWTNELTWQWSAVSIRNASNSEAPTFKPDGSCIVTLPRVFDFSEGPQSVLFTKREGSSRMDKLIITRDLSYVPSGNGSCP